MSLDELQRSWDGLARKDAMWAVLTGPVGGDRAWDAVTLGPFDWPEGAPLVLAAFGPHPPGELNGVVLDRVGFAWQE